MGLIDEFRDTNEIVAAVIKNNHSNWSWVDVFTPMPDNDGKPDKSYFIADGL